MADVAGRPVTTLKNYYGSSLGAAWVAAIGSGQDLRWEDIGRLVGHGETFQPDPARVAVYDRGYRDFRALYETLKPFFHRSLT